MPAGGVRCLSPGSNQQQHQFPHALSGGFPLAQPRASLCWTFPCSPTSQNASLGGSALDVCLQGHSMLPRGLGGHQQGLVWLRLGVCDTGSVWHRLSVAQAQRGTHRLSVAQAQCGRGASSPRQEAALQALNGHHKSCQDRGGQSRVAAAGTPRAQRLRAQPGALAGHREGGCDVPGVPTGTQRVWGLCCSLWAGAGALLPPPCPGCCLTLLGWFHLG